MITVLSVIIWLNLSGNFVRNSMVMPLTTISALERNLNQRDTIAVRRMVDGYLKLMYPNGEFTKEELEEVIQIALEMRRRVKEQLKKLAAWSFMM